jgi:hypothetical protein
MRVGVADRLRHDLGQSHVAREAAGFVFDVDAAPDELQGGLVARERQEYPMGVVVLVADDHRVGEEPNFAVVLEPDLRKLLKGLHVDLAAAVDEVDVLVVAGDRKPHAHARRPLRKQRKGP